MIGLIRRSIHYIFEELHRQKQEEEEENEFVLKASFLELYQEELSDLLNPMNNNNTTQSEDLSTNNKNNSKTSKKTTNPKRRKNLITLRENGNGEMIWNGIREETITNVEQLLQ